MDAELFRCASQPKLSFLPSSIVQVIAPSGNSLSAEEVFLEDSPERCRKSPRHRRIHAALHFRALHVNTAQDYSSNMVQYNSFVDKVASLSDLGIHLT